MKRIILLLIIIVCVTANSTAQQIPLKGEVTVQNSKTNTGKTQYVKNAEASHPKAKPDVTDDDGKFTLVITGEKPNTQTQISIIPHGEYSDYVVVNEKELRDITLGRERPVKVYVCKKGDLEQRQAEMVGINMRKLEARLEKQKKRLQNELEELKAKNDYLNVRYSQIKDSLNIINENIDNAFERILEYAQTMSLENLDEREENYIKAYECFARGELDSVSYYLPEHELDLKYQQILQLQQEAKKEKNLAAVLTESAKQKEEYSEKSLNELVKEWALLARTADMQNEYEKAIKFYENVVNADSVNLDNIVEYANYLRKIREYAKAEKYFRRCLEIYEELNKQYPDAFLPELSNILNSFGSNYYNQKNFDEAEKQFLRCLEIRGQLAKELPNVYLSELGKTLNVLGNNYRDQKNFDEAEKQFLHCLEIYEQLDKEYPNVYLSNLARALNSLGVNYYDQKNYAEAERYLLRGLEIREVLAKENPKMYLPYLARILNTLGNNYNDQRDYAIAEQYLLRCVELFERLTKENPKVYSPNLAGALYGLGNNCFDKTEYVEAEKHYLRCLEIYEELAKEHSRAYSYDLARALNVLGNNYQAQGNYPKAEKYYLRNLEIFEQLTKENPKVYSINLAHALMNIGNNYMYQTNYMEAEKYHLRSLEIYEQLAKENPKVYLLNLAKVLLNIGSNYSYQANYMEAEKYLLSSLNIYEQLAKENPKAYSFDLANASLTIGNNYREQKNYSEAEKYYLRSLEIYEQLAKEQHGIYVNVSEVCTNFAWMYLFKKEYTQSEKLSIRAFEVNSANILSKTNLAHALLFQNRFSEAETIYKELSQTIMVGDETYTPIILEDLEDLENAGAVPEEHKDDVEKIRKMLKEL